VGAAGVVPLEGGESHTPEEGAGERDILDAATVVRWVLTAAA
jgi:hypothetical protein